MLVLTGCSTDDGGGRNGGDAADASETPGPPTAPGLTLHPDATEFAQDLGEHSTLTDPVELSVSLEKSGGQVRPQNIGISLEATDLADPRLDPDASSLDERLGELGSPALRFGGNRLDRNLFWTSSGEEPPDADSVVVGPDDLERLRRLADATDVTITLGIPLGDFDPDRGADMAAHAQQILGDALVAVSIGNEPNGYTRGRGAEPPPARRLVGRRRQCGTGGDLRRCGGGRGPRPADRRPGHTTRSGCAASRDRM